VCTHWSSNDGFSESDTHGETEGHCRSYSTGINPSKSISMGTPIESFSFWTPHTYTSHSARVRNAAAPLERRLRKLAQSLTLSEFHQLRTQLEDCCDEILLNGV
jgi:hypothetical protein